MTDLTEKEREKINQWWTEYMGECWHEPEDYWEGSYVMCKKCKAVYLKDEHPDCLSDAAFLPCLRRAREDEDWFPFLNWYRYGKPGFKRDITPTNSVKIDLIDSPTFQVAWWEWIERKEKG